MTKVEELTLLERIEELIADAGVDSYIGMTFAGVPEICRRNIENDWGDSPVADLEEERKRHNKAEAEQFFKIQGLELQAENARAYHELAEQAMSDMDDQITDWKNKFSDAISRGEEQMTMLRDEMNDQLKEAGELYAELEKECGEKDTEIMRLKAEIYDLRKERV